MSSVHLEIEIFFFNLCRYTKIDSWLRLQRIFGASVGHDSGDYLCVPCPLSQKLPPRIPSSPPLRRDVTVYKGDGAS